MNTESIQVAAPSSLADSQWWPDLYLKKGRKLQLITREQCGPLATEYRNRAMEDGRGASSTPPIKLYDQDAQLVARIWWNGTVQTVEGMEIP